MNYYKGVYSCPEYWLKNKERYERRYKDKIQPRLAQIQQWLDEGESIRQIARNLGTSTQAIAVYRYLFPTEIGEMFEKAIEKRRAQEVKVKTAHHKTTYIPSKKETLCWQCAHIVPSMRKGHGCEWSLYDKPVPGWEATETKLTVAEGNLIRSYCVHKCPKFKKFRRGDD